MHSRHEQPFSSAEAKPSQHHRSHHDSRAAPNQNHLDRGQWYHIEPNQGRKFVTLTSTLREVNDGASWLLLPPALLWRCCWVLGEGEGRWARGSEKMMPLWGT